jgi:cell division initiation protein
MSLTPNDVDNATFKEKFKGYDMDEVDAFLERVTARLQELIEENDALRARLRTAESTSGESEQLIQRTLLTAQRTADEVVEQAKAEADRLVAQARDDAVRDRERLREEAEQLTNAIAELKQFRVTYQQRLQAVIEQQMERLQQTSVLPDVPQEIDDLTHSVQASSGAAERVVDLPDDEPGPSALDPERADARAGD